MSGCLSTTSSLEAVRAQPPKCHQKVVLRSIRAQSASVETPADDKNIDHIDGLGRIQSVLVGRLLTHVASVMRGSLHRLAKAASQRPVLNRAYTNRSALPLWNQTSRRMLVSQSTGVVLVRPVLTRSLGYSTIPKILLNLVRVPAFIGATFTAGIVYVQYKVEGMLWCWTQFALVS